MQRYLAFFKSNLAKKLLARNSFYEIQNVTYRNSILLDLVVRARGNSDSFFGLLFFFPIALMFRIRVLCLYLRSDLLILPADIWDLVFLKMRNRIMLEVRWLTQDLIDSLNIPNLEFHHEKVLNGSCIPVMPKKVFQEFRGFVTYSNIAKQSIELSGAEPAKILVIPLLNSEESDSVNQLNLQRLNRLLYVGRSAPDKRLDLAVEIAKRLNTPIDIVGKYNKTTIDWLGRQNCVNFVGAIPHNEVLKLMKSNRALLAPGAESWGLAVVEALQCGMEVFASRFTGVTEWIAHPNLHILDEMNADLFVNELSISTPVSGVYKIFNRYDLVEIWKNFLAK